MKNIRFQKIQGEVFSLKALELHEEISGCRNFDISKKNLNQSN